jgi:hypothetical protein
MPAHRKEGTGVYDNAPLRERRSEPGKLLKNQSEIYPGDHATEFQPHVETFPDAGPQEEGTAATNRRCMRSAGRAPKERKPRCGPLGPTKSWAPDQP